jgi:putative oxidoreductase
VQRLFSMFPRGWPGVALLLLRASVLSALLFQDHDQRQQLIVWMHGFAIVLSVALAVGYQTPIIAVMGLLFHGLIWARLGIGSIAEVTIISLDAMALALLGPGAYSLDSYRFGRRVLILPPPPP